MCDAAGAAFLLFVGLLPAALAAVMVPFLNYVPFEEASVRSCFTSGAHLRPERRLSAAGRGVAFMQRVTLRSANACSPVRQL